MSKILETFENTLDQIRTILRKEGITGMDSIKHCLAFTVSRFLTNENCNKLDIDNKYSFESLIDKDEQEMRELFFNSSYECIVGQICEKMHFQTHFKLESPSNLRNILNKIKDININELSTNYDIVGIIYELHLKTGTSQAMRDLGQYFSNRSVIKYMVKLCDPKIKKNGEIETILDPTMGTAGFLAMSIKHLNNNKKKVDWVKNKNNIYGFDIDENVKNMAILNLFLETGQIFDRTLIKHDTLHKDFELEDKTFIDKVDVILANEPFGIKGLKYADCCERIKKLKIDGTKAEPLFLQLMMQSLNVKGRCAVIVPDGVLFNDAKLHKGTRKHLCNNFNLLKVISLEDGLFLNTGVKSSILFFVNDGETTKVEFCKIKMLNDDIVEESIIKVNVDEIEQNDYTLFVNKYNKVEANKIDGLEYKKLGEICEIITGNSQEIKLDIGYPVYGGGGISYYTNNYNTDENTIILSRVGLTKSTMLNFIKEKIWLLDSGFKLILKTDVIRYKYLYYILYNIKDIIISIGQGSAQKTINKVNLGKIEIPIPSITIQEQIVESLDVIYDTIEGNKKLIENYEKIKKGIIFSCTFNVDKKKLGDMYKIKSGKFNSRDANKTGLYPFYNSEASSPIGFIDDYCFDGYNYLILIKDGGSGQGKYGNNIGLGKVFKVSNKTAATSHQLALFPNKEINNNYFYYFLQNIKNKIMDMAQYTTGLGTIRKSDIENINIPIPTNEVQEYIVKECDYYDNLIDILKKENERLQNNKIIELMLNSVPSNDVVV
jgi:type I restriction-modification system DNA methylase subunit/restriction endonuclease S subunit